MKAAVRPVVLFTVLLVACALFAAGLLRLHIDTDVINAMPTADPVIRETAAVFANHPIQDQVLIDLSLSEPDPDLLVRYAAEAQRILEESGLFSEVGAKSWQSAIPALIQQVAANLPDLFTAAQLEQQVAPRLRPAAVAQRMAETVNALSSLSGIGRASLIEKDPLGLSEIVLARLKGAAPSQSARIYKGRVISEDGAHLLLPAKPARSATDTEFGRRVEARIEALQGRLNENVQAVRPVRVTTVGAYRSALDNERMIRSDVQTALLLSAAGIVLLLLAAFCRPLLGLLALVPAAVGAMAAVFVYSLFDDAISAMVLGFGGAVISITVDHGIAYLLFVDRSVETDGRKASAEVRAVGLLAALTSIGAFSALTLTGFPAFRQLGLFAALGIGISFLFVHTVFPRVFGAMPPSGRPERGLLSRAADSLAGFGKPGAAAALAAAVVLAFFARPGFDVSLNAMNTVSSQTRAAEAMFSKVWGGIFDRVFVMVEDEDLSGLRKKMDAVYRKVQSDVETGVLDKGFVPAAVFPGPVLAAENRAAWRAFFTPDRVRTVKDRLLSISAEYGFSRDAFAPFFRQLSAGAAEDPAVPLSETFFDLAGISRARQDNHWVQVSTLTTGSAYDGANFRDRYQGLAKIFDPAYFSERLGRLLFSSFTTLLSVIAASVAVLLFFFFLDAAVTAVSLLPVGFALVCTLGTLTLLGRPLDIPGLMLAIVVIGMGIDYSLFFVRSFQRYGSLADPSFSRIRLAVFMAGASTLIGFGALTFSEHTLLKSAGITSFLGIGYAMIGAFLILPPAMQSLQGRRRRPLAPGAPAAQRVLRRYRNLEAYPRLFARFKLRSDPMFAELEGLLPDGPVCRIIDVGTGYGVPAAWLLERYPNAKSWGIEPDEDRARAAAMALADRAEIRCAAAPSVPVPPEPADLAVVLDMIHYLDDASFSQTLEKIRAHLKPGGILLLRAAVPPKRRFAFLWLLEKARLKRQRAARHDRSEEQIGRTIEACGFRIERTRPSGDETGELVWWKAAAGGAGKKERR